MVLPAWMATPTRALNLPRCCRTTGRCFARRSKRSTARAGAARFGNMTLSRLPVLQVASHLLPGRRTVSPRSMRRQALEVTVQAGFGPIRIVNTHLEYSFRGPARGADRAAAGFAGGGLRNPIGRHADACASPMEARSVAASEPAVRRFQFRCRPTRSIALLHGLIAAGTELSRRMDDLPSGPAASADLRHSRSRAMAQRRGLPRFHLRHRGPGQPRSPHGGR